MRTEELPGMPIQVHLDHKRWTDRVFTWALSGIGTLLAMLIAVIIWIFGSLPGDIRQLREEMSTFRADLVYVKRSMDNIEALRQDAATTQEQVRSLGRSVDKLEDKTDDHEKRLTRVEVKGKF